MNLNTILRPHYEQPGGPDPGRLRRSARFRSDRIWVSEALWDRRIHAESRPGRGTLPAIVLLREGTYTKRVGSRIQVSDPNHAMLYNASHEYTVSHPAGDRVRGTTFILSPALVEDALRDFGATGVDPMDPFDRLAVSLSSRAYLLYRLLGRLLDSEPVDALRVEEALDALVLAVFGEILRGERASHEWSSARDRVGRRIPDVQRRLSADLDRRVSLDELAELAGCSRWRLSRVFRERIGIGIAAYRRSLRLRAALVRILDGCDDLTRVALDTGFANHAHLTSSIGREFGCSPSQLRRLDY